jgi:hypothetical protein
MLSAASASNTPRVILAIALKVIEGVKSTLAGT